MQYLLSHTLLARVLRPDKMNRSCQARLMRPRVVNSRDEQYPIACAMLLLLGIGSASPTLLAQLNGDASPSAALPPFTC